MSKTRLEPKRLKRSHSVAGSKGHPCESVFNSWKSCSIHRQIPLYMWQSSIEIHKTQGNGSRYLERERHITESPLEKIQAILHLLNYAFSHPSVTFNLTPWSRRNHYPCATEYIFIFPSWDRFGSKNISVFSLMPTRISSFVQVSFNGT